MASHIFHWNRNRNKDGPESFQVPITQQSLLVLSEQMASGAAPHAPAEQVEANEYPDDPSSSDSHLFCPVSYGLMSDDLCNFLNALCDVLS